MSLIWWVVPALAGVVGLMLSFAGLGRLMKLRLAAGGLRFLFGIGLMGAAGVGTFIGLNLQTYKALTKERDVAEITFAQDAGAIGFLRCQSGNRAFALRLFGNRSDARLD